jgi:hypothetical protein
MHTVIETEAYQRSAIASGVSEQERLEISNYISANPTAGEVMKGTGGARKIRFAGRGKGKRGGYRVITYYADEDVPVFLLDLFAKGDAVNLTKAERNELREILASLVDDYRASVKDKVAVLGRQTKAG